MQSFMTEFPVDHSRGIADFLSTVEFWILGSPHTAFGKDDLVDFLKQREAKLRKHNEFLEVLQVDVDDGQERAGIRYTRTEDNRVWITSVVFDRGAEQSWVSIRVSCESNLPAVSLPPAKKPVLVRTFLERLGGGQDGPNWVGDKCVRLVQSDIDLAARLIRGKAGCRLPIVYVSANFQNKHIIDPDRLARDLSGMAHVVVEPNRHFSVRLKIEVASENVYGGTIGIYWPEGGGRHVFFLGKEFANSSALSKAIVDEVRVALSNRRGLDVCTWPFLQEAVSRRAIRRLRESGSRELDVYIENFDKELAAKQEQLAEANNEILRLKSVMRGYESKLASVSGAGMLRSGSETDLYPDEVLRIIVDALTDAVSRVTKDSRRQHVLVSIISANQGCEDEASRMRLQIKELLRDARGVDVRVRRGLEELGFTITEDGKHYKLQFRDDERYTFTLPKTGSDYRGGLNAASDIGKLLF